MIRTVETQAAEGLKESTMRHLSKNGIRANRRSPRVRIGTGFVVGVLLAGCASSGAESTSQGGPATVEAVKGTDVSRVTLTEEAMRRIDVRFGTVGGETAAAQVPYSAVLYDPDGATWAFVNPRGRTFVRAAITVERIEGDTAFLTAGPPPGTRVVTVGAPELYGAELGVGDDE